MTKSNDKITCHECGLGVSEGVLTGNRWKLTQKLINFDPVLHGWCPTEIEIYFCSLDCLKKWIVNYLS